MTNKLSEKEQKEMSESMKESAQTPAIISPEQHLTTPGINIQGLEEADPATIPLPFARLVQPTSKGVKTSEGEEAPVGSFFFSDTNTALESPTIVILKGKHGVKTFNDMTTGEPVQKKVLAVLGYIPETEKVFILTLSVMSFNGFGHFMAQLKEKHAEACFQYQTTISSHLVENDRGKFYVADFNLGEELSDELYVKAAELYAQYQSVVSTKPFDEKIEEVEEIDPNDIPADLE
jgi:hypothetical protein